MEIEELNQLLAEPSRLIEQIRLQKNAPNSDFKTSEYHLDEFNIEGHDVLNKTLRPDKMIRTPTGRTNTDGSEELIPSLQAVSRIPVALQKLIVSRAAAFLVGSPVQRSAAPKTPQDFKLAGMIDKTWQDNKLDFRSKRLAKLMMSETECAEIWYSEACDPAYWEGLGNANSKFKARMTIIANSYGDRLYPVFDNVADMIAFGREYHIKVDGVQVPKFDVYTADRIYRYKGATNDIVLEQEVQHTYGKIPVIYYYQPKTEWNDVQYAIERLETLLSNFADTNDYNGAPILFVEGAITGFSAKGESGKILEGEAGTKVQYISWTHAPESIKLEIENLFKIIYTITQTPNITFDEMKGLGKVSGVAISLMFMDAHMKAKDKQDDYFGEAIQRRINLLKSIMSTLNTDVAASVNLDINAVFTAFRPQDEAERIADLVNATGGKQIMSRQTATELNPLVSDSEEELIRIKKEEAEAPAPPIKPIPLTKPVA